MTCETKMGGKIYVHVHQLGHEVLKMSSVDMLVHPHYLGAY